MALDGRLTIQFGDGRETVALRFQVSAEGEAVLRQYVEQTDDVLKAIQRVGGLPVELNISFQQGEGLRFNTVEPTEDQRAVILHKLRPMLLKKEPASFDRACAVVSRSTDHEFMSAHLRRLRDVYNGTDLRSTVIISRGETVLNSEAAFEHWLNGFEYHRDADRAAVITDADALLPLEAIRPLYLTMLQEKLKAMTLLANIASKMLERRSTDVPASASSEPTTPGGTKPVEG